MAENPTDVIITGLDSSAQLALPQKKNDNKVLPDNGAPKKKRGVNILKVALMLLRRRSGKSKAADVASNGMWNRLVGSMRPLHVQSNLAAEQIAPLPEPEPEPQPPLLLSSSPSVENFEDMSSPPYSPEVPISSSTSSVDSMSRYASAVNLQDLDEEESNKECEGGKLVGEDEMIDAKAEVFIAQFYAQMKLQRTDSDVRYEEMIKRSIG